MILESAWRAVNVLHVNADHCAFNPMQAKILDHWHELSSEAGIPLRSEINPGKFASALGHISLVELGDRGFRFRLSGSLLEDVFQNAGKGRLLSEMDAAVEEAGSASMSIALETGRIVFGDRQFGSRWHSWLRLPLRDETGEARLVLCFDEITNHPCWKESSQVQREIRSHPTVIAA